MKLCLEFFPFWSFEIVSNFGSFGLAQDRFSCFEFFLLRGLDPPIERETGNAIKPTFRRSKQGGGVWKRRVFFPRIPTLMNPLRLGSAFRRDCATAGPTLSRIRPG